LEPHASDYRTDPAIRNANDSGARIVAPATNKVRIVALADQLGLWPFFTNVCRASCR
jgi:hypothetical protein